MALFVERAQASQADFRLTEGNAADVAELCRRLDGLPLALELAAARVRTFTVRAMVERLANRTGLLTGGPRDLPARQRTLAATLDWSHDLLEEPEQQAFRRLSVFAGGFTLEAAEAVVDPFAGLGRSTVDLVESLHDKSLVQRSTDDEEEPRFALLETIREYAAQHLEHAGEQAPTRRAHAAYFLVLAEEAGAAFAEGRGPEWLDRFRAEAANFRAALDWLIATDDATWGMRMAQGLFPFWEQGESFSEGRRRYERLLALPSASEPTALGAPLDAPLKARAVFNAGVLAAGQGDRARGVDLHRQCLELYRHVGDRRGQAVALNGLGVQLTGLGRYSEARACYEESMELWEELGESHGAAAALSNFAFVLRNQGELERSRRLYRQAAAMFERLGDPVGAAWEISHEADVVLDRRHRAGGDASGREEAGQLYRAALERFRTHEQPWGIGSALMDLGALAQESGELERGGPELPGGPGHVLAGRPPAGRGARARGPRSAGRRARRPHGGAPARGSGRAAPRAARPPAHRSGPRELTGQGGDRGLRARRLGRGGDRPAQRPGAADRATGRGAPSTSGVIRRVQQAAHGRDPVDRQADELGVAANRFLVRRDVDAVDLVVGDVGVQPLDLRSERAERFERPRRGLADLLLADIADVGDFPFDDVLRHGPLPRIAPHDPTPRPWAAGTGSRPR